MVRPIHRIFPSEKKKQYVSLGSYLAPAVDKSLKNLDKVESLNLWAAYLRQLLIEKSPTYLGI